MKFTKMHGIGNDYIYFDCTKREIKNPEALSVKLSEYHFGVGADGIVLILKSAVADFKMRMFNADGSEGKMCGNASRCIGKYVYERRLTDKTEITLETLSGIKHLSLDVNCGKVESVTIDMGKADFCAKNIPVISDKAEVIDSVVKIAGSDVKGTCVSMGNPHFVVFTKDIEDLDLEKIGPEFENASIFPERVNTEFASVINETKIKMRVWERGSGETLACGTGACAVVSAAVRCGICKTGTFITVKLTGGELKIKYKTDGSVIMKGGATFVFDGELAEDLCLE